MDFQTALTAIQAGNQAIKDISRIWETLTAPQQETIKTELNSIQQENDALFRRLDAKLGNAANIEP